MEIILLNELNWDILLVTPVEYIDYLFNIILLKLNDIKIDTKKLLADSTNLIYSCLIGIYFVHLNFNCIFKKACILESDCLSIKPNVVASACLLLAFENSYLTDEDGDDNVLLRSVKDIIVTETNLNLVSFFWNCFLIHCL